MRSESRSFCLWPEESSVFFGDARLVSEAIRLWVSQARRPFRYPNGRRGLQPSAVRSVAPSCQHPVATPPRTACQDFDRPVRTSPEGRPSSPSLRLVGGFANPCEAGVIANGEFAVAAELTILARHGATTCSS